LMDATTAMLAGVVLCVVPHTPTGAAMRRGRGAWPAGVTSVVDEGVSALDDLAAFESLSAQVARCERRRVNWPRPKVMHDIALRVWLDGREQTSRGMGAGRSTRRLGRFAARCRGETAVH
jgi:hypothetical protein